MKNLFVKMMALGLFLVGAQAAHADGGIFVEPMLTYENSKSTIDYNFTGISNSSGTVNGAGFGARLGMHASDVIFLAADLRYSKPDYKDSSNNMTSSATAYNYGAVLGVQMPIVGLRVWGSYILGGELDPSSSTLGGFTYDQKFTGGTGYRVGVGMQVILVSVNLEYQQMEYKTTNIEQAGPLTNFTTDAKLKNESYILSVSFPIAL